MGKKWGSNRDIHPGDIFQCRVNDDWFWMYQVTALRGKTQVALHAIQSECFVDEGIAPDSPLSWRRKLERPLLGQYAPKEQVIKYGFWCKGEYQEITSEETLAWVLPERAADGRHYLQAVGPASRRCGVCFQQVLPEDWQPLPAERIQELEQAARQEANLADD